MAIFFDPEKSRRRGEDQEEKKSYMVD